MDRRVDGEDSEPIKDYGSFCINPRVGREDIEAHHKDKWQHSAMYVGLHFPQQRKRRHRRRHHHKKHDDHRDNGPERPEDEDKTSAEDEDSRATPPGQRVQFILGTEDTEGHAAHDVFCEMEELRQVGDDGEMVWKETARWVKFEEVVEEGGERWSKPHVATLSLHSLFELRKGILSGTVMLDIEGVDLVQITDLVLDNMVASDELDLTHRDQVQDALLSRHRHQHEKDRHKHEHGKGLPLIRSLADIGRKASEKKIDDGMRSSSTGGMGMSKRGSSKDLNPHHLESSSNELTSTPSTQKFNEHFAKKIPAGAEASNILVGELDFLANPIIAFVRLNKAIMLGDLTEVPVPTRFIFVLLGPNGHQKRYHEIGRSIATLMSDEVFHEIAYKAKSRNDLLAGIDEFLDQVTVLPPGEWDPTIRIEPPKSVPSQEGRKKPGPDGQLPNGTTMIEEEVEEHGDITLQRTGRLFGGLIADVKRKLPWYWSDVKDCAHVQCIASFFFMYFACLTPIITFGGLLGAATDNNIAAMESLVSGAICGVSYHLFSGQPLTIIGSTGPVLVFETIVFHFCQERNWDYLGFRLWIGMWVCIILLFIVMFDLSALVRFITRFTEESFAVLIALIFIYEAFKKLFHILDTHPVDKYPSIPKDYNCSCVPITDSANSTSSRFTTSVWEMTTSAFSNSSNVTDWDLITKKEDCEKAGGELIGSGCDTPRYFGDIFFLCCLLFIGTFALAITLKGFRTARIFPTMVRTLVSDFAVFSAIIIMVVADYLIGLNTPKLEVPEQFRPTRTDRGWLVNPFGTDNPVWLIPAAILPALLATILIFMDQQITAVIVNRKENKLRKGGGYHLDLLLIAIQIGVCSVLGTPWFVAATVLSINHVRSLTKESESAAPGERPKFLGIREQRVTGTLVFIMVGLSALLSTVLKLIPMAVLYGVFLFMGLSSVSGLQLVQRIMIVFMPPKYQPDYVFLRNVPLRRVHLFTAIQVICLACLWVIKTIKSISIIFPLMVLAMCFVRKALDWVFTRHELKWLDDIMPESHKHEKEEKKKKLELEMGIAETAAGKTEQQVIEMTGGMVNIPLKEGKSVSIPVDRITFDPVTNQINISDEMSKTAIWKQIVANESHGNLQDYTVRQRKNANGDKNDPKKKDSTQVRFNIADDETDSLMGTPEIVIDPPSKSSTPDVERSSKI